MSDNILRYKGYTASVQFDADDGILVGIVLGIKDIIDFHGDSVETIRKEFKVAIDEYIKACKKLGREPNKPRQGKIVLALPIEIEAGLEQVVEETGKSAKALILDAVKDTYFSSGGKTLQSEQKSARATSKKKRVQLV